MNRAFILVFDRSSNIDYNLLYDKIKNDADIKNWWHYMLSAYILITPLTSDQLTNRVMSYLPDHRFLIFDITGQSYNGWLPKGAWNWIKQHTR